MRHKSIYLYLLLRILRGVFGFIDKLLTQIFRIGSRIIDKMEITLLAHVKRGISCISR